MAKEIKKNAPEAVVESNATELPKENDKPKKARKPREKVRPVEEIELMKIPATKLTDKEKNKLIDHLRDALETVNMKLAHYQTNAESAFNQTREMEKKYNAMERYYLESFKEVNLQLSAFAKSINRVTGGVK